MAIADNRDPYARRRSQQTNPFTQQPQDPLRMAILDQAPAGGYYSQRERTELPTPPPQAPTYGLQVGDFGSRLEGYDPTKLANAEHKTPKYLMGRTLSNFDPSQGVTPEVLAALNTLGIGTFSGSGDRLKVANGSAEFNGITDFDVIRDFGGDNAWKYGGITNTPVMPNGQIPPPQAMAPAAAPRRAPAPQPVNTSRQLVGTSGRGPAPAELPAHLGLSDQSQWQPGDTPAIVAARAMAAHGGTLTPEQRATLERIIITGQMPTYNQAAPAPTGGPAIPHQVSDYPAGVDPYRGVGSLTDPALQQAITSPYGNYPGRPAATNFLAPEVSQFTAPNFAEFEGAQDAILRNILANPETMNATAVAQLKERQKEEALEMQRQQMAALEQDALSRGVSGGGSVEASRRRMEESLLSDLIRGNREVDLQKMEQDRKDQLQALATADAMMATRGARASDFYRTGLQGEMAQADQNYRAAGSALSNYSTDLDAYFNALAADDRSRGLDINQSLGQQGIGLDYARLGESGRQFDLSHQLALQQFLQNASNFKDTLGFNYANLNYNAQMDPWKIIFGL